VKLQKIFQKQVPDNFQKIKDLKKLLGKCYGIMLNYNMLKGFLIAIKTFRSYGSLIFIIINQGLTTPGNNISCLRQF